MSQVINDEIEIKLSIIDVVLITDPENYFGDQVINLTINRKANIQEMLYKAGLIDNQGEKVGDLTHYYRALIIKDYYSHRLLPFIIDNKNEILLDVPYSEATIEDFLSTHDIADRTISITIGIPASSGWGTLPDVIELWDYAIRVIVTLTYIYIFTKWAFLRTIKHLRNKQNRVIRMSPDIFFSLVLSRSEWDIQDFARIANLTIKQSKLFLEISGYQWEPQINKYTKSIYSDELRDKISNMYSL